MSHWTVAKLCQIYNTVFRVQQFLLSAHYHLGNHVQCSWLGSHYRLLADAAKSVGLSSHQKGLAKTTINRPHWGNWGTWKKSSNIPSTLLYSTAWKTCSIHKSIQSLCNWPSNSNSEVGCWDERNTKTSQNHVIVATTHRCLPESICPKRVWSYSSYITATC